MFSKSFIHKVLSEFLQPFRYVGMTRVSLYLLVVLIFYLVLDFWLAQSTDCSSGIPEEHGSPRNCLSTLSLGVEVDKLEEELVDEPRTTIGTKFSVLHCIRIPFSVRCGF